MRIQLYDNNADLKKTIIADNMEVINSNLYTTIFIFYENKIKEKYIVKHDESFSVYDK